MVQTGFLTEDKLIAAAYNACDTFIMTSIAESFEAGRIGSHVVVNLVSAFLPEELLT